MYGPEGNSSFVFPRVPMFPRWSDEVNLIIGDNKMTMVAAQWEEVLASDEGRNTKWLELHIYDIQLQLKLTMRFLIGKYTNRLDGFLVSKETVVLRRWGSSKQKFGFIKRVDRGWITCVKDLESWRFER